MFIETLDCYGHGNILELSFYLTSPEAASIITQYFHGNEFYLKHSNLGE
jgi:hypothetical protein